MNLKFLLNTTSLSSLPSFVGILAFLGAIQGIILFVLLFQRRKNKSNLYLAFFLLTFSSHIFLYSDPTFEFYLQHPYLVIPIDCIPLLQTPLIYFYFFLTLNKNSSPRLPFLIHAIPAILNFIGMHGLYFYLGSDQIGAIVKQTIQESPHIIITLSNWSKFIVGIFYTGLIVNLIYQYAQKSPGWTKNRKQRNWLITLTSTFIFCWLVVIATGIVVYNYKTTESIVKIFLILQIVCLTGAMYLIAYFAFRHPSLFPEELVRNKIARKLNITSDKLSAFETKLNHLMVEEQYYLNENSSLQIISEKLHIHPNALSYIINEKYGKNFNEYLNEKRLNHFIHLLKDESENTILRLAFESGFSSKTTFNRAFKNRYNQTPVEYIKNNFPTN